MAPSKFLLPLMATFSIAGPASFAAIAGSMDFGAANWIDNGTGMAPPVTSTAAGNAPYVAATNSFTHTNGSTMTVSTFAGNSLGTSTGGSVGFDMLQPGYEFSASQVRTEFAPNDLGGSTGGDFAYNAYDVDFSSAVGCNGFVAAGDFVNMTGSSLNGASEAYEWSIVVLKDQFGNPLGSFNPAALSTYDPNNYGSLTIAEHATGTTGGTWGAATQGVFGWDDFNTTVDNTLPPSTTNPQTGSGGGAGFDDVAQTDFGFALTDTTAISGFTWYSGIYDVSLATDANGYSHTNSSPSAGLNDFVWDNLLEPEVIPEPSRALLVAFGVAGLFLRRRRS